MRRAPALRSCAACGCGVRSRAASSPAQFIAHRLGLIPLLSHKAREMIFPYQDDTSADSVAGITLTLDVRCTGDDPVLVTSDDLRSEDPAVLPVGHPHARGGEELDGGGRKEGIIIAKLRKGQALRVTCTARKGIGKDHAKWSPVATAVFRYQPQVTLRQDVIRRMTPAQRADWCASDPNQILKYDAVSGAVSLGDVEAYAYDRECIIRAAELGFPTAIEIVQKQDTFIFTVEATGALPPAEIVLNGARRFPAVDTCARARRGQEPAR